MATKEQPTIDLITYSFPEQGVAIEAIDIDDAYTKIKKLKESK